MQIFLLFPADFADGADFRKYFVTKYYQEKNGMSAVIEVGFY
jgi:hypothetical protein